MACEIGCEYVYGSGAGDCNGVEILDIGHGDFGRQVHILNFRKIYDPPHAHELNLNFS